MQQKIKEFIQEQLVESEIIYCRYLNNPHHNDNKYVQDIINFNHGKIALAKQILESLQENIGGSDE
jgi:hypothetical protein